MNPHLSAMTRYLHRPHPASGRTGTGHRKARRTRLYLEPLEDRAVPTAVAAPSGLVSWWTANGTANDLMGLNNATLYNGTAYAAGEVGQAFSFNGVNTRAEVADSSSLAFTASFTIEGWIKVNSFGSSSGEILFRGDDRPGLDPYQLRTNSDGTLSFQIDPLNDNGSTISTPIPLGQFLHVAGTLDDATGLMSLYVNGSLAAQTTTDGRPFANLDPTQNPGVGIGNANGSSFNVPFNGLIDELSVYNRALSPGEVLGIYKAGSDGKVFSPIAVSNPSVIEGAAGTTQPETFTITRTGSVSGPLTVNWATADDTAKAGTDYVAASGTATFADGQATQTVQITVNGSSTDGPNKTFDLIATPAGGTSVMGVATIQNDNSAVSISDASAQEGNTTFRYFDHFIPVESQVGGARHVAFGPDGNLYVASRFTDSVLKFDGKTGAFLGVVVPSGSFGPHAAPWALTFGPDGNLYVAGVLSNNVLRYNMATGAIDEFIPSSSGLYYAKGLTFDALGDLLVSCSDTGSGDSSPLRDQVLRFQGPNGVSPGAPLPASGQSGAVFVPSRSGGLSTAQALAFGPDDNLYIVSAGTNTVNRYNGTTGASMGTFVSAGSGGLNGPQFLSFRPDGFLYVSSQNNGAVYRFSATTGALVGTVVPVSTGAGGMTWDADGNLYVVESYYNSNMQATVDRYGVASQEAFTVSLDYASALPITVSYSTADGTAKAGTNYTAVVNGTVVFAPGETSKTILIQTLDDGIIEPNSSFTVTLSNPTGATLARSQGTGTIVENDPTLSVVIAPSSVAAGSPFGLTVHANDSSGNLESSFNGTVTVALASNPGGATLGGTLSVKASHGVAFFSGLKLTAAASGYTLQVSTSGFNGATTSGITVIPAVASQLLIRTQPSSTATAGQAFGAQPVVVEEDRYGNIETADNSTIVRAAHSSGSGPLQGATATVVGGVATFTKLADNTAETLSLKFTGAGLSSATSTNIVVSPAAASKLMIQTQPSASATAGQAFNSQPVIYEEDQYGNLETGDNSTMVTATLSSGAGPLQGTTAVMVTGGIATFTNLADNTAETISLGFTGGGLTQATSASIVVSPGAASQLVIQTQPSATATAGQAFRSQPVIDEKDQYGNLETGDNSTVVTAALAGGAGPLQGATATVAGGVATFTGLADNTAETLSLRFTGGGLTSLPTNSIVVSPAPAGKLVIHTQPSASATAGQAFSSQPVIYEEDPYGNLETGDNGTVVTAGLNSGAGPLRGTTATAVGGVATFAGLADNTAETLSLRFTGGGLTSLPANAIVVSPATASQLAIHTQPSSTEAAGQAFATQPVIYEEDQYGNLETGDNSRVVTAALHSGAGPLQGTETVTVSGGIAAFTSLADNRAETISLGFTGGGLTSATSTNVAVSPGTASQLVIQTQPSATATAGQAFTSQPMVLEEDQYGNLETGDNTTVVTAALAGGAGPLQGATATVAGGVATFAGLADNKAETLSLKFTGGGLTSLPTNSIVVSPAAASQLVIHTQPSPTAAAGQRFATQPVIYEEDQFGDLETGDNSTVVTAVLSSGTGPLQGTAAIAVSGGVATFTNLADNKAGSISLGFTGAGLSTATSTKMVVSPASASQLVIHTQPSSTATAGQAFGAQPVIYEEDQYGNLETGDNSTVVTAALSSGTGPLQGPTAVTVSGGVATFAGLADNTGETAALRFTSGSLSSAPTSPIAVTAAVTATPPTIQLERVLTARKTNKKGKPVGKSVFVGFELDYSTAMNPSAAGLAANYQVNSAITKLVKRKKVTVLQPARFTAAYNPSTHAVTLMIQGKPKFTKGGQIRVIAAPPSGVTSAAGVSLDANDTAFTILPNARGIVPLA